MEDIIFYLTVGIQIITTIGLITALIWQRKDRRVEGAKFKSLESQLSVHERIYSGVEISIQISAEQIIHNYGDKTSWFTITDVRLFYDGMEYRSENSEGKMSLFSRLFTVNYHESTTFQFPFNYGNYGTKSNEKREIIVINYYYFDKKDKKITDKLDIPIIFMNDQARSRLSMEKNKSSVMDKNK